MTLFVISMVCQCIHIIHNKHLAWSVHNDKVIAPELDKIDVIKELLRVKFGQSILPHFDIADTDVAIKQSCTK